MKLARVPRSRVDDVLVAEVTRLWEDARREVLPAAAPQTARETGTELLHGWDGDPQELTLASAGERLLGFATLTLPTRDNNHTGWLWAVVDPPARRGGVGAALLDDAARRMRALGRRSLGVEVADGSPGEQLVRTRGFARRGTDVIRTLAISDADGDRLAALLAEARAASAGYRVEPVGVPVPDETVPAALAMLTAINDAPTDDLDIEDEVFDVDRLRGFERSMALRGRRVHWLAAWGPDGQPAGHTIVTVSEDNPGWGEQLDTSVRREHRGHRLGLRLKLEMLRRLRGREPQLATLVTWNAASNRHMIAVNEQMGHRVQGVWHQYQKDVST